MADNLDRDLQHMYKVIDKLDTAIEKLSDVSTDIKQILAVHEQRLDQTESIMERHFVQMDAVHNRVSSLRDDMTTTHQEVLERIAEINKWRWQIMGGAAVIATVITMMGEVMHLAG
jgi:capsule polysaccharide export protein KpsE/RkpR